MSTWKQRVCAKCEVLRPKSAYTKKKWEKGRNISRCARCVHGGAETPAPAPAPLADASLRNGVASWATFRGDALLFPAGEGSFLQAAEGVYTQGPRVGQPCVCKWVNPIALLGQRFTAEEGSRKALEIANLFNQDQEVIGHPDVFVSVPEVMAVDWHPDFPEGVKCLLEPFIVGWQKFNCIRWAPPEPRAGWERRWEVVQALSHFSYHVSGGQLVLCDLQSGLCDGRFVLADPTVVSRVEGAWGGTDAGQEGFEKFFRHHICNSFCRPHWTRPGV